MDTKTPDASALVGLTRELEVEDFAEVSVVGRYEFLIALQMYWPDFWRGLKSMVVDACTHFDNDHVSEIGELFRGWAERNQIVDRWLQDACWQTIEGWSLRPRNSLLTPDHKIWFFYAPEEPVLLYFCPTFADSRPLFKKPVPDGLSFFGVRFHDATTPMKDRENPDEFERRIRSQFDSQLRKYKKYLKARFSEASLIYRDSTWAALLMSGKPAAQIALTWKDAHRYKDPEQAIYRAAKRFADGIGLTLSCTRKTLKNRGSARGGI